MPDGESLYKAPRVSWQTKQWLMVLAFMLGATGIYLLFEKRGPPDDEGKRKVALAQVQIHNIGQSITQYLIENKRLPMALTDLLSMQPGEQTPYLSKIPDDPWGHPYAYRALNARKYVIQSRGEDGTEGTEDDLFYPEPE